MTALLHNFLSQLHMDAPYKAAPITLVPHFDGIDVDNCCCFSCMYLLHACAMSWRDLMYGCSDHHRCFTS